jgi:hypothetical protein
MHRMAAMPAALVLAAAMLHGCHPTKPGPGATMQPGMSGAADDPAGARRAPRVRGARVHLGSIEVTPAGSARFALGVAGLPVEVELPPPGAATAVVHVTSPLVFDGIARVDDLPVQTARAAELAGGRVRATAGMRVPSARLTAVGPRADLEVARGVVVRDVQVAEDLLTLDLVPRPPAMLSVGAAAWQPRGSAVHLYPIEGTAAPLTIEVTGALALVLEVQPGERGGMVPVQARWSDGAALIGRVKLAELRELGPDETFAPAELEEGPPGLTDTCGVRSTPRGVSRGVRRISAGAVIYAEPGRGAWARVAAPVDLEIELAPGAAYATIVKVPGLLQLGEPCAESARTWVDARALAGPPPAP